MLHVLQQSSAVGLSYLRVHLAPPLGPCIVHCLCLHGQVCGVVYVSGDQLLPLLICMYVYRSGVK